MSNFGRELNDYFAETDDESNGFATGFKKLDEEDFRCRAGELIVVTGPNGSGKSMLTDFVGMNSTKQGKNSDCQYGNETCHDAQSDGAETRQKVEII